MPLRIGLWTAIRPRRWSVLLPGAMLIAIIGLGCHDESADDGLTRHMPGDVSVVPQKSEAPQVGPIHLTNISPHTGIAFQHTDGGSGQKYLVETVSAGMALFDFDGDGFVDIFFLNGAPLPPAKPNASITNALYHNNGDLEFRDVTQSAGLADIGYGLGVAAADYDGDGNIDLYLNNFGPNVLYRNNGDGTFVDVTLEAGVDCGSMVGAGAAFLDADRDGDLDLYVANYFQFDFKMHLRRTIDGYPCYPGPLDYEPAPDVFFRNNGDGTFTDVSAEAGILQTPGTGMGMVCADYDNDRDTDVFVVNDELPNLLFDNDGTGRFTEVGILRGFAFDRQGKPQGSMGLDCGDFDNDGWLDFFATSFSREMPTLYRNQHGLFFEDATLACGVGKAARQHVNWGTGFADLDNDGWHDLFIANGHIDQQVHQWNANTAFRVRNIVLHNTGDGHFEDVSHQCGSGLEPIESSRGTGLDDLDNDGDIDAVVLNSRSTPTVLRNDTSNHNHWLQIELLSPSPNRNGVGAQVRVTANGITQMEEVHSGRGYQSHYGQRIHFGLGTAQRADRVVVSWLDGSVDVRENVSANQRLMIQKSREEL